MYSRLTLVRFIYGLFNIKKLNKYIISAEPCVGFPGPGNAHYATFNPMKEFIRPHSSEHVDFEFNKFLGKHGKQYSTSEEHNKRKDVFRQNLR